MSEAIVLSRREEGQAQKRRNLKRVVWVFLGVLLFLAVMELIVALLISPNLTIKHLIVESDFGISENEVLSIAGMERKEYYFSIKSEDIRERLAAYPLVRNARVEKVFPDTIRVSLSRRTPLALAFGKNDQRVVPVAFDEEGVVFQIGKSVTNWQLPVFSGLVFKPQLGLRLPKKLLPVLKELYHLRSNSPDIFGLISEIKVTAVNDLDYEMIFYPIEHNMRINLGDRFQENLLKYSFLVLDVLDKQGVTDKVKELDFRTGEVVYRIREEEE